MALGDLGGGILAGIQGVQDFSQRLEDNKARDRQLTQMDRRLNLESRRQMQAIKEHEAQVKQWGVENADRKTKLGIDQQNADSSTENAAANTKNANTNALLADIEVSKEKREQFEFDQGKAQVSAQEAHAGMKHLGLIDKENGTKLAVKPLTQALARGDNRQVDLSAVQILNTSPRPDGFTFTAIDRTTVPGKLIVRGKYEDGREGVMTAQGGVQEGEEVVALSPQEAARLLSNEYTQVSVKAWGGTGLTQILTAQDIGFAARDAMEAVQTTNVVSAVDAGGNVGMSRALRSALGAAETDEQRASILTDVASQIGVDYTPPAPEVPSDQLVDYTPPKGNSAMKDGMRFDYDVFRSGKIQIDGYNGQIKRLKRKLEEGVNTPQQVQKLQTKLFDLEQKRDAIIDDRNRASLESVEAEIADYQDKAINSRGDNKEYWEGLLNEKTAKRDEILTALGELTPVMKTQEYKNLETAVFDRLDGMSVQEVDALVDSGNLPFNEAQIATMRQRLQEASVSSASDLLKLPSKEQIAAYAMISTIAGDATARDAWRGEFANLIETGTPSMSAKDIDASQRDRSKTAASMYSYVTSRMDLLERTRKNASAEMKDAAGIASDAFAKARSNFFNETDGTFIATMDAARKFANMLPEIQSKAAPYARGTEEFDLIDDAVSSGVSLTVAAFVNEADAGIVENVANFFRFRDDPNGQISDFNLSRVIVDDPVRPTKIQYLGPGGRIAQGREIPLSELQKLDQNIYNIVRQRAVENSKARMG